MRYTWKKTSLANKIAKTEGPKNIPGNICSLFQPNKSHPLWYSHNTYLIKSTGKERNFCWNAQRCSEKRPQSYPQFLVYVTTQYSTTESNTISKGLNTRLVSTKTVRTGNSDYATPPQHTHSVHLTVQVQLPFSSCTSLMETEQHNSSRSGSNQTRTIKKKLGGKGQSIWRYGKRACKVVLGESYTSQLEAERHLQPYQPQNDYGSSRTDAPALILHKFTV